MMTSKFLPLAALALSLAACQQNKEPEVVGEIPDPQAEELAHAAPIDPATVPMRIGGDDYRCTGSNALINIDWIKTGEQMSARVTPQGSGGVSVVQGDDGVYTDGGSNTLSGSPTSDSVTFNGASCKK